jgi:hypothetical protein
MRTLGATIAEEPYRVLVMEFLNMVLGRVEGPPSKEETSAHFWHVELKQSILKDFMVHSPSPHPHHPHHTAD